MDLSRIKVFKADFPEQAFPSYRSLSQAECEDILKRLYGKLSLQVTQDSVTLDTIIRDRSTQFADDIDENSISVSSMFRGMEIAVPSAVILKWNSWVELTEFSFSDFEKYFGYLFLPGADDLDVFDSTMSWVVSFTHSRAVYFVKF